MINGALTHPEVLSALARAGHSAMVLVADGHFPAATAVAKDVPKVFLNYAPGMLTVPQVLEPLVAAIPIESAVAATFEDGSKPEVWADYERLLPSLEVGTVKGSQLGGVVNVPSLALVILTSDLRPATCIALTMGLRRN